MNKMPCSVIVHAEGFGCHASFNEGIERAHRYGLVTSAGVAATGGNALDDAVRRAHALPALDLGLQFLLLDSAGQPLTLRQLTAAWLRGEMPTREMAGRLRAQLDLLRRVHGLSLSHITLSPGLHLFPPLMRVVSAVAMEYDISGVRFSAECRPILRPFARMSQRSVAAYQRRTPDRVWDRQGSLTPISFTELLRHAPPGITEIVCRPGILNRVVNGSAQDQGEWERDLQSVCDEAARAAVRFGPVTLATWQDV
jgi:predicted glycoside hydrolase/deacetylase ChbG (UPF0249 family)